MQNGVSGEEFFKDIFCADGSYKYYLAGEWKASESGKTVNVVNPMTNETAFYVQACTRAEVDQGYEAAKVAQQQWACTPLSKRADLLHEIARLLRAHAESIAKVLVQEVGKGPKDSMKEVIRSAELLAYCAEEGVRVLGQGEMLASDSSQGQPRNKLSLVHRVPLGVVLCIPPFNYPVNLAVSKLGPALMAGNGVVFKPPTQGAVAGVLLTRVMDAAGVPKGLVNLLTGRGSEIGDYLTTHPACSCISFTGGDTGLDIAKKASMIPLQMELGGKDVCIVCHDANLDVAAQHIVSGAFSYSGQRCTAVKIVLAESSVADVLLSKINAKVANLTVGPPDENPDIGPVISKSSADFISTLVEDAKQKGAVLCQEWRREGNLIWPLVVDAIGPHMKLAWEEPFGPVLPFMRVDDPWEGVKHCNENRLALQGCVFSQDIDRAISIANAMSTGTVQINAAPSRGPDHFPFQGFRDSGIGSQGIRNTLLMMSKVKSVVVNLQQPSYPIG